MELNLVSLLKPRLALVVNELQRWTSNKRGSLPRYKEWRVIWIQTHPLGCNLVQHTTLRLQMAMSNLRQVLGDAAVVPAVPRETEILSVPSKRERWGTALWIRLNGIEMSGHNSLAQIMSRPTDLRNYEGRVRRPYAVLRNVLKTTCFVTTLLASSNGDLKTYPFWFTAAKQSGADI